MTFRLNENTIIETEMPLLTNSEQQKMSDEGIPESLGILPLKNTVLFPGVVIPITVGRDKSIQLVKDAYTSEERLIGVVSQQNVEIEHPDTTDLFKVGVVARIMKLLKMPDGSITIIIQGRNRFTIDKFIQSEPYFKAAITKLREANLDEQRAAALMNTLKQEAYKIIELSPNIPTDAKVILENIDNLSFLIHFIASNLNIKVEDKQEILKENSLPKKAEIVLKFLAKELTVLELSEEIQSKVRTDIDKQQREYFLRQQIKAIQNELGEGGGESDVDTFKEKAKKKKWPVEVEEVFYSELKKLNRMSPQMPDYAVVVNYLDWLIELPWESYSEDQFNFEYAQEVLDKDHYGLEKVKDRILEHLAVLKLRKNKKAPILCFYGPPGVGKTSLGKSIAKSLGREFVRISLGGVRDEAEIRGHRRTYIGAMPGRIIQGMKKAKTGNPVFMLDEIDKVGNDFRGDPSSALLEVLDPEQNNSFHDHYLEVEYDLSKVMFIATANSLGNIHPALRDRMEIIEINGYSQEEKVEIAKRHLIPTLKDEHGIEPEMLDFKENAIRSIIKGYTRESGVRNLSQKIAAICRGAAREIVFHKGKSLSVDEEMVKKILGVPRFEDSMYQKVEVPGVSIGLAWTPVGGDILFIETTLYRGSGKLSMTGQLGDVMKESATLAYKYLKANGEQFGIPYQVFKDWDIHIHFPAGAIPKDGPSAGIAILSAMASAFSQRKVVPRLAMTGEITLRGKVLPVGGIKEKILAAIRAGMNKVILCKANEKDVSEINPDYLKNLEIIYVEDMHKVLEMALQKKKVAKALQLEVASKTVNAAK